MSLCLFRDSCSDIYINYYINVHDNGQSALQNHLCKVLFASYGVQIDRLYYIVRSWLLSNYCYFKTSSVCRFAYHMLLRLLPKNWIDLCVEAELLKKKCFKCSIEVKNVLVLWNIDYSSNLNLTPLTLLQNLLHDFLTIDSLF